MSVSLSRRQFVCSAIAAVAATTAPVTPSLGASPVVTPTPFPAWVVGTPGENDGQIIRALTSDEAIKIAAAESSGEDGCFCEMAKARWGNDECDFCHEMNGYGAWRAEALDNIRDPTPADWIKAGFGHLCQRCDYECGSSDAHVVNREVVCQDCMELADWEIVDPDRTADLRVNPSR